MYSIPQEWLIFGSIIALAMLGVAFVVSLIRVNKKLMERLSLQAKQNQLLESKVDVLTQQLSLLNKGTLGMGKRLMSTEKRLNQTMERQDSMENRSSEQISFKQAAKLFERGLEVDNVVEKAGITRSEAKLMDMFQQKQAASLED